MNNKMLVPLDGSKHAFKALEYACDLAEKYGSTVTLLHVVVSREIPEAVRQYVEVEHIEEPPGYVYEQMVAENVLGEGERRAREHGVKGVRKVIEHGDPTETILGVAKNEGCDAIVMGTRGLSDIRGLVVGSVAHKVSHLAPCTVITVR
ncbi:MAG: universal stress protein [Gammaproteobacteria bacterium]|nr:universal stress protein [Gammaproteobacteria bacterium]NIR83549.1 universal stress protein [Gammaproteobacteria bacterium]NIR91471.1 universal stress protein [Gammaproteobacteria bacterium]NIU04711.1 universal stress protein [Gammaproteobacteria bacterium]NIV51753.1 universal stress protein [Gammaproteobacteria bacterium]